MFTHSFWPAGELCNTNFCCCLFLLWIQILTVQKKNDVWNVWDCRQVKLQYGNTGFQDALWTDLKTEYNSFQTDMNSGCNAVVSARQRTNLCFLFVLTSFRFYINISGVQTSFPPWSFFELSPVVLSFPHCLALTATHTFRFSGLY